MSLFELNNYYRLKNFLNNVDVFFFDELNTTIYATDDQIEELLEILNVWYIKAKYENDIFHVNKRLEKIEKEKKELKGML